MRVHFSQGGAYLHPRCVTIALTRHAKSQACGAGAESEERESGGVPEGAATGERAGCRRTGRAWSVLTMPFCFAALDMDFLVFAVLADGYIFNASETKPGRATGCGAKTPSEGGFRQTVPVLQLVCAQPGYRARAK